MLKDKESWDEYFKESWEKYDGLGQTTFFYKVALLNMPCWLDKVIMDNKLSILDAGCAEGQATKLLSDRYKCSRVTGLDFSEEAINKSKNLYKDIEFLCKDFNSIDENFDVIYSSNTLEHFEEPLKILEKFTHVTNEFIILLVPFEEFKRIEHHYYTFTYESFPLKINNFYLMSANEVDCKDIKDGYKFWTGKQMFVIYARDNVFDKYNFNFKTLLSETVKDI